MSSTHATAPTTPGRNKFPILHGEMSIKMWMGRYGPIHSDLRKYVDGENKPRTNLMPLDLSAECQEKPFSFDIQDGEMMETYLKEVESTRIRAIQLTDLPNLLCSSQYETVNGENGKPVILGRGGNGTAFHGRCKETDQLVTLKFENKDDPSSTSSKALSALEECAVQKRAFEAVQLAESKGECVAKIPKVYGVLKLKDESEYLRAYHSYIIVTEFIGFVPNNPVALTWNKAVDLCMENDTVFDNATFANMFCALIRTTEILVENHMMHADIKGNNILICIHDSKHVPYLIDFGNAFEQIETKIRIYDVDDCDWLDPYLFQGDAPTKTGDLYSLMVLIANATDDMERMKPMADLACWYRGTTVDKCFNHSQVLLKIQHLKLHV